MRKFLLGYFIFIISIVSVTSAVTINSFQISPGGPQPEGTPVSLSFNISVPSGASSVNDLQLSTILDNPNWSYVIFVNDVGNGETISRTKTLTINSFLLTYKSGDDVRVNVTLTGTAPADDVSQPLLEISEVDSTGYRTTLNQYTGNMECSLSRSIPSSVTPGSTLTITLTPNQTLTAVPGWEAKETFPYGFTLISANSFYEIQTGPTSYTFIQTSSTPIAYVLRAPMTEGPYVINGTYIDGNRNRGTIAGDSAIIVGTTYSTYQNTITGKIEKADAQRALTDYLNGRITNAEAGSVLQDYFLGQ
jgi:hypothetical protein